MEEDAHYKGGCKMKWFKKWFGCLSPLEIIVFFVVIIMIFRGASALMGNPVMYEQWKQDNLPSEPLK